MQKVSMYRQDICATVYEGTLHWNPVFINLFAVSNEDLRAGASRTLGLHFGRHLVRPVTRRDDGTEYTDLFDWSTCITQIFVCVFQCYSTTKALFLSIFSSLQHNISNNNKGVFMQA